MVIQQTLKVTTVLVVISVLAFVLISEIIYADVLSMGKEGHKVTITEAIKVDDDSVKAYRQAWKYYYENKVDQAEVVLRSIIERGANPIVGANSHALLGWIHFYRDSSHNAEMSFKTAYAIYKRHGMLTDALLCRIALGEVYMSIDRHYAALTEIEEAQKLIDHINDKGVRSIDMAKFYKLCKRYEYKYGDIQEAYNFALLYMEYSENANDRFGTADAYIDLSIMNARMGNFDLAQAYYTKADTAIFKIRDERLRGYNMLTQLYIATRNGEQLLISTYVEEIRAIAVTYNDRKLRHSMNDILGEYNYEK